MSPAIASGHDEPPVSRHECVVGIDTSLTKTGVGIITPTYAHGIQLDHRRPVEKSKRAKSGLPPTVTLPERDDCLRAAVDQVLDVVGRPTLVVIYDVLNAVKIAGAARVDIPAGWSLLVGRLARGGVPIATLQDSTARKAIAGPRPRGESRESAKLATGLAVAKLWPDVEIASDDVADALAAAHLGAVALGLDVPTLARHHEVKWSEWPELPDPTAKGAA